MDGAFNYDIVVIGSGAAGMASAIRASELGATAAVVEQAEAVGGTCVNIGCIPSKYLIEAAHHYHTARTSVAGIAACNATLDWNAIVREKTQIVETLRREKYMDVLAAYEGVSLLRGHAELLGAGRVRVNEQTLKAGTIVIATGTRPALPPIAGLSETGALDSTSVMELERLPESMIVIGGGTIGVELGQAISRFGVRVVIVEAQDRILPEEDPDVSAAVAEALRAENIEIHTGVNVRRVGRSGDGYRVELAEGSLRGELKAEQLLVAAGRRPNSEHLGLDAAGVTVDQRGFIVVDDFMRTTASGVYAAGDVVGGPGFVYVAALGGGIAVQAALAEQSGEQPIAMDLAATPRVTFTDPQVAAVGMTEAQARATGSAIKVAVLPISYLPRAVVSGHGSGLIKLIADSASDRLLGAHVVSTNAGDVIGQAVLAVKFGLRVQEIVSALHPYLTWAEGLKLAGQTFSKDIAKLSCCA